MLTIIFKQFLIKFIVQQNLEIPMCLSLNNVLTIHNIFFRVFQNSEDSGTMVPGDTGDESGTMIQHATLIPRGSGDTSEIESNLGTMVINEDSDEDTMKRTCSRNSGEGCKKERFNNISSLKNDFAKFFKQML